MQYHIPAIETPARGTHRLLTDLLDDLGDRLAGEGTLSDNNIHEMRKTCKKLRALLRMMRPALDADGFLALEPMIRDFARQLAGLRDSKVMQDTLAQLGQHFAPVLHAQALAPVQGALRHLYEQHAGSPPEPALLRTRLSAVVSAAGQADCGRVNTETLLAGLVDNYRRGRRALGRMESAPDTEQGHSLRRVAKYHYYQLQMLSAWNEAELRPAVGEFHRLEDTLGKDHDLAVLGETLERHPDLCPDRIRRELLTALIESRRIALLSESLRLARKLYRLKPGGYRQQLEAAFARPVVA